MRDIIKTTVPLFIICIVTAFCLSYVNSMTKEPIRQAVEKEAKERKAAVLSSAQSFEEIADIASLIGKDSIVLSASKGISGGKAVGYVFVSEPKGYGGAVSVTVGVGMDGKITGVKLGDNKETPGLGTKAGEPPFLDQFAAKNIAEKIELVKKPPVGNQVQAISGATISSRAVTNAVQASADAAALLIAKEGTAK
ncbi:MAG: RnfABCDGE type electron transport complex subunit G [Spirochaetota bacterium]